MKRTYIYVVVGLVAGVVAVRQAALAAQQERQGGLGEALREFWAEVQVGMAEREEELRTSLGLDGTHDMVDAHL